MTFPWPTVGGYDFYEVLSALQKSIRRGLQDDALFWSSELYMSEYQSHAWHRLLIISSEDIGPADPGIAVQIRSLYENWKDLKKDDGAKLFFVDAVLRLVNAKKSRIVDHSLIVSFEGERVHREIPDYALDVHTSRGRAMGRNQKHFFEEGAQLGNGGTDEYAERAKEIRIKRAGECVILT